MKSQTILQCAQRSLAASSTTISFFLCKLNAHDSVDTKLDFVIQNSNVYKNEKLG